MAAIQTFEKQKRRPYASQHLVVPFLIMFNNDERRAIEVLNFTIFILMAFFLVLFLKELLPKDSFIAPWFALIISWPSIITQNFGFNSEHSFYMIFFLAAFLTAKIYKSQASNLKLLILHGASIGLAIALKGPEGLLYVAIPSSFFIFRRSDFQTKDILTSVFISIAAIGYLSISKENFFLSDTLISTLLFATAAFVIRFSFRFSPWLLSLGSVLMLLIGSHTRTVLGYSIGNSFELPAENKASNIYEALQMYYTHISEGHYSWQLHLVLPWGILAILVFIFQKYKLQKKISLLLKDLAKIALSTFVLFLVPSLGVAYGNLDTRYFFLTPILFLLLVIIPASYLSKKFLVFSTLICLFSSLFLCLT